MESQHRIFEAMVPRVLEGMQKRITKRILSGFAKATVAKIPEENPGAIRSANPKQI